MSRPSRVRSDDRTPLRVSAPERYRPPLRPLLRPSTLPVQPFRKRPVTIPPLPDRLPACMTVCIAAMSSIVGAVVTVTDFMLSDDISSVESRQIKMETLANTWHCLYSGDPSLFAELSGHIERELRAATEIPSCGDVVLAVERAYETSLEHRIERRVLAPFGMTRSEFMQNGLTRFDDETFRRIIGQMEDRSHFLPGTELLISGFDSKGKPHIISADVYGDCTIRDGVGFHAIGAGSLAALGWLLTNSRFRFSKSIAEIGYRLCEAKFIAEMAPGVGRYSLLAAFFPDGTGAHLLMIDPSDPVRKAWEARRNRKGAPSAIKKIHSAFTADMDQQGFKRSI
jgi:hypothetical protein